MKLVLTFIFSGILTFTIFSQNGVSFDWANRLGNGFNIWSSNITKDNSGNIYTVGRFSGTMDFDPGPNSSTLNLGGSARDGFIQKLDSNGNFLWVKGFGAQNSTGSSQHVSCSSIAVDDSNNIYVSGGFSSIVDFDPGPGVFNLTPTSTATSYFVKLDSNGQFISARLSENGIRNMVYKNGYLYNFGTFQGTEDFDPGVGTEYLTANIIDTYVQKLDINDSLIWVSSFSGINGGECRLYSQSIDSLDNIYVIGGFSGTVDFDSDNINIANITSFGTNDGYIVKLNNSGDYIWSKNVGRTNSNTELTAITEDLTNVYLIGYFNDTIDADPGLSTFNISPKPNTVGGLSFDAYILKLDSAGNFINVNVIGGAEIDFINSISIDQYSNIYMTGYFSDTVDFDPSPNVYHLISDGVESMNSILICTQ